MMLRTKMKSFSYSSMQKECDISVKRIDRYISVLAPLFFLEGGNVTLFSACIIGQEIRRLEVRYGSKFYSYFSSVCRIEDRFDNAILYNPASLKEIACGIEELYESIEEEEDELPHYLEQYCDIISETKMRQFAKEHGGKIWGSGLFS